jgi:putative transcriptional regulator
MISEVITIQLDSILKKRDKSLYWLAQETGITYTNLWKIKNGKVKGITFDVLEKLCNTLDCKPNDLLKTDKSK